MVQRTAIVLVVAQWLLGCVSEQQNHAPELDCSNDECTGTPTVYSGGGGEANSGGSSNATAGAAGEVTITGQIVEIGEPHYSISAGTIAAGNFAVTAPGADGDDVSKTVTASFTLDEVKSSKSVWLSATPKTTSDLLPGLIPLNTTTTTKTWVPLVRKSSLESVASVLMTYVTLDSSKGQVVVKFVDNKEKPVPGIRLHVSGTDVVAYDDGGTYSDDTSAKTGSQGLAFLLNVDAAKTPAAKVVTMTGAVSGEFAVWVEAGAASVLEVLVSTD